MLSGQQYQLASGQQPAGHEVSFGPHCSDLRSLSLLALATESTTKAIIILILDAGVKLRLGIFRINPYISCFSDKEPNEIIKYL